MAVYCPERMGPALYLDCKECDDKICEYFFCLVAGTRTFTDYEFLEEKLDAILKYQTKIVIVSGGASGADSLAKRYAEEHNYRYIEFPAKWDTYGKRAGWIRNAEMHEFISRFSHRGVVCFWNGNSKGTAHNFELCEKYKNPLRKIFYAA